MTESKNRRIDDALILRLLSVQKHPEQEASCMDVGVLAEVLAGNTSPVLKGVADGHLKACSACREALLLLGQLSAAGRLGPLPVSKRADSRRWVASLLRPGSTHRYFAAAAALFVLLLGAVLLRSFSGFQGESSTSGLVVKGETDAIFVAVQRGGSQYTLKPMDTLRAEDAIGLFYSANTDGYLAVFGVDMSTESALIFPANRNKSAPVSTAEKAPLPDGATVMDGNGCQWLVGVFSDIPLDLEVVAKLLQKAAKSTKRCELQVEIPGARSVQTVPFLI